MSASVSRTSFLEYLEARDYIHVGNISADWDSVVKESEALVEQYPDYWCSLVPSDGEFESWDTIGDEYIQSMKQFQDWGYSKHNTQSWETTSQRPQLQMEWEKSVLDWLPLDHSVSRPTLQRPGNVMPWHEDKFFFFKRKHPEQYQNVVRFIVFMKDWETGHLLQAGNSMITHWKAGDVILWYPSRMHIGANVGFTNKWTQNVTGILKDIVRFPGVDLDI